MVEVGAESFGVHVPENIVSACANSIGTMVVLSINVPQNVYSERKFFKRDSTLITFCAPC